MGNCRLCVYCLLKGNGYPFKKDNSFKIVFAPFKKRIYFYRKGFPGKRGLVYRKVNRKSQKSLVQNGRNQPSVSIHINLCHAE